MEMITNPGGKVERTNVGNSHICSIGDPALVMDLLSKLYNNPRKIVPQEYMSNARDAHREAGCEDKPIQVWLPTQLDPFFIIKDFGPGLSRDRVENVFTVLGASTKRGSNLETGGFGIGSKCGFAYTDSFQVISRVDGTETTYVLYKNEDNIIEMTVLAEESTKEPNGVTIKIKVDDHDFDYFEQYFKEVTEYWDVKPDLKRGEVEYDNRTIVEKGDGWYFFTRDDDSWNRHRGEPFVILDGLKYPINSDVYAGLENDERKVTNLNIALVFKTGEVRPATNRENLEFSDSAKTKICERLSEIYGILKDTLAKKIASAANLYEANLLWESLDDEIGLKDLIGKCEWNGFRVNGQPIGAKEGDSYVAYYNRSDYVSEDRIRSKKENNLKFVKDSLVVINDDGGVRISPLRIQTIFAKTNVETIQVIQILDDTARASWVERGLNKLGAVKISQYEKAKRKRAKSGDRKVNKVYKHNGTTYRRLTDNWSGADVDLKQDVGIYVEYERGDTCYYNRTLAWFIKNFGIEVIGVPSRFIPQVEKNEDMVPLRKWLEDKYQELLAGVKEKTHLQREWAFMNTCNLYQMCRSSGLCDFLRANMDEFNKDTLISRMVRYVKIVERYNKRLDISDQKLLIDMAEKMNKPNPLKDDKHFESRLVEHKNMFGRNDVMPLLKFLDWGELNQATDAEGEALRTMVIDHINEFTVDKIQQKIAEEKAEAEKKAKKDIQEGVEIPA